MRDLSSLAKDWARVPWRRGWILNHWTTREVPACEVRGTTTHTGLSAHCPRLFPVPRDATFSSDAFPSSPLLTLLHTVHLHSQRSTEVYTVRPCLRLALLANMISLDFCIILSLPLAEVFCTTMSFHPDGCVCAVLKCTDFGKTALENYCWV